MHQRTSFLPRFWDAVRLWCHVLWHTSNGKAHVRLNLVARMGNAQVQFWDTVTETANGRTRGAQGQVREQCIRRTKHQSETMQLSRRVSAVGAQDRRVAAHQFTVVPFVVSRLCVTPTRPPALYNPMHCKCKGRSHPSQIERNRATWNGCTRGAVRQRARHRQQLLPQSGGGRRENEFIRACGKAHVCSSPRYQPGREVGPRRRNPTV